MTSFAPIVYSCVCVRCRIKHASVAKVKGNHGTLYEHAPSTSDSLVSDVPTLLSFSDCTHKLYNFTHCPRRISGIFNVIANNLHRIDWTGQVRYWTQSLLWTCCLLASKERYISCLTKSVCLWVSQVKGSNCFAWSPLHEYRAGADSLTSAHILQQNNDGGNGIIFLSASHLHSVIILPKNFVKFFFSH